MAEKKPFSLPENLSELSADELAELRTTATDAINEINDLDADLSAEQLDEIERVLSARDEIVAREAEVAAEAQALADRQAAVRERVVAATETPEEPVEEAPEEESPAEDAPEEPTETEEVEVVEEIAQPEPVLAAGTRKPTVAAAAKKAPAVIIKKEEPVSSPLTITAAANVPEFNAGQTLEDMGEVTQAFLQRVQSFGGSNSKEMKAGTLALSPNATRYGVARIRKEAGEHQVDREMSLEQQFAVIAGAAKESALSGGSVIAAGGWCAPSETIYSLFGYETTEGLLDVPEVTARRGGISFTKGPDFATIFADSNAGFIQTEAEAIAGTEKPCYALECPPFTEVRLDAIGYCATAPILTEAAYPELVRRVLDLLGVGHARRKNATTISRIAASAGTAIDFAEIGGALGSGTADALGALELQAIRIRQTLAMGLNETIEGFAPHWLRAAFRHELSRRLGLTDPFNVTDAHVDSWLAARNIRLQFVYDYQMLTPTSTANWTAWPTSAEVVLYPAGAYTRLVNDVISLDAVYDHDLLTQNTYTAAFAEEGLAIANTRGFGVKVSFDLRYNGSAGFPAIGAGEGVTFAAAA